MSKFVSTIGIQDHVISLQWLIANDLNLTDRCLNWVCFQFVVIERAVKISRAG